LAGYLVDCDLPNDQTQLSSIHQSFERNKLLSRFNYRFLPGSEHMVTAIFTEAEKMI